MHEPVDQRDEVERHSQDGVPLPAPDERLLRLGRQRVESPPLLRDGSGVEHPLCGAPPLLQPWVEQSDHFVSQRDGHLVGGRDVSRPGHDGFREREGGAPERQGIFGARGWADWPKETRSFEFDAAVEHFRSTDH